MSFVAETFIDVMEVEEDGICEFFHCGLYYLLLDMAWLLLLNLLQLTLALRKIFSLFNNFHSLFHCEKTRKHRDLQLVA